MGFYALFLLAVGLSMDAFAIAVCAGLGMDKATFKKALTIGLYFGVSQAVMPLIGYAGASFFADKILHYGHWIAFILLNILGIGMIISSFKKENHVIKEISTRPAKMLPLAIATSIDAMAVGVSFAFIQVNIIPAVTFIGATTLVLSIAGVKLGNLFGLRFKSKAEFIGGCILMLIGLKILLEHMGMA
jgi:putative Mn2+ efflux pump MntP